MIFYIHTFNLFFALGGLVLFVFTLVLLYDYLFNNSVWYQRFVSKYVWYLLILVSFGGVATTLLYSEYFGFVPCSLCWLQRIALYPQAIMGIVAYKVRDQVFFPLYGMVISILGFLVAVYHYIYQMVPREVLTSGVLPCLADGTTDCGDKVMEVFGFVTFPMLSAITFAFFTVIFIHMRRLKN